MGGQITAVGGYLADGDTGAEISGSSGGDVEGGEGDGATIDHFTAPGDDSPPLEGDYALVVPLEGESDTLATASYSDDTAKVAARGEKRTYARDSSGAVTAEIHMKGDGEIAIQQVGGASAVIAPDGEITLANSAASVAVSATGEITLSGVSVSLAQGTPLGEFLIALHAGVLAWVPVPQDGGAALKASLGSWLGKAPPAP